VSGANYASFKRAAGTLYVPTAKQIHVGNAIALTGITSPAITASSVTAVANATAQLWGKGRVQVNTIKALASGSGWELLYIDAGGTTPKLETYITCLGTGGPYTVSMKVTSNVVTLNSSSVTQAALPANGQDVIWAFGYDNTGFHQRVWLFDSLGNVLCSVSTNNNDGALTSGNGFVGINSNSGNASARSCVLDGVALYAGAAPADGNGAWWSKPSPGDPNIAYLNYMNDASSGTTPTASVAAVGSAALTWPTTFYNYTTDSTSGNWG
jgi:hypothetical protein